MVVSLEKIVYSLNCLANFFELRDTSDLSEFSVNKYFEGNVADICVLLGGNNIRGVDYLASVIENNLATYSAIVGGIGRATSGLISSILSDCEFNYLGFSDDINKLSEAEILNIILKSKYDLIPSFLEINSKNAGENVSYLFDLLSSKNIEVKNLILIQDSPFQLRLNATFKHYDGKIKILNFAPYKSHFSFDFHSCSIINIGSNGSPWSVKELASLYIGEFERVYDGIAGYGPKGLNYIAHIDVPENVVNAFHNVKSWISTEVVVENI